MRALFQSLLGYFLSPAGLVALGILDASLVFFVPLGIDFALVLVSARQPDRFWLYALAATAGSVMGTAGTFWIGRKLGEKGLARWMGPGRLKRVQARVSGRTATGVAALAIIPPPFPFTALALASGAFSLDTWRFFTTLAAVRALRFGAEAGLAARFGERIIAWKDSAVFEVLVGVLVTVAVVGTVVSVATAIRSSRGRA